MQKIEGLLADKPRFERNVRRIVRRIDVQRAILIAETHTGKRHDLVLRYLHKGRMSEDLALLEYAKAIILNDAFKSWQEGES